MCRGAQGTARRGVARPNNKQSEQTDNVAGVLVIKALFEAGFGGILLRWQSSESWPSSTTTTTATIYIILQSIILYDIIVSSIKPHFF